MPDSLLHLGRHMLQFLEGNAEQLPIASESQDSYSIAFGIRNVTHIDTALEEAYRVRGPLRACSW